MDPQSIRRLPRLVAIGGIAVALLAASAIPAIAQEGTTTIPTSSTTPAAEVPVTHPETGWVIDSSTGFPIDPATGFAIDPVSGQAYDPATGGQIDPVTGLPIDPAVAPGSDVPATVPETETISEQETTVPADGGSQPGQEPSAEPVSEDPQPGGDPLLNEDPPVNDDPLVNEEPGEPAPETGVTVPEPTGTYAGQPEYRANEILWSSVRQAEAKLTSAREVYHEAIGQVREVRLEHKRLRALRSGLDDESQEKLADAADAETRLEKRAIAAFMTDGTASFSALGSLGGSQDEILDFTIRQHLVTVALESDTDALSDYLQARSRLDDKSLTLSDTMRDVEREMATFEDEAGLALADVDQAEAEAEAFRAGSSIFIADVVFPVVPPDLPLIDSFGFPRMPGTADEHWHEGIDIFAPSGTPLVATERGIVTKTGNGRLGGLTVWLRGESGTDWYYAHLLDHAPGIVPGVVVEAGDLLGWVGNTGNAISTPPHLHMEMHPGGMEPVNPYPLLKIVSDRDQARGGPALLDELTPTGD